MVIVNFIKKGTGFG